MHAGDVPLELFHAPVVEQLSMALEDEREEIKVIRKKNSNNIRDLQRQLQQSKRCLHERND